MSPRPDWSVSRTVPTENSVGRYIEVLQGYNSISRNATNWIGARDHAEVRFRTVWVTKLEEESSTQNTES